MARPPASRKAALLVDWENFRGALARRNVRCDERTIAQQLISSAKKLASEYDATLYYEAAFAGPESLGRAAKELQDGGLALEMSTVAKNAADTKLVVSTMKLCLKEGYKVFLVVSGDVDYIDLAKAVKEEAATCVLLPPDETNLKVEMRRWDGPMVYVRDLIKLEEAPPPKVDELDLFCLLCQITVRESGRLFYNKARDEFAKPFAGLETSFESAWDTARSPQQRVLSTNERVADDPRPLNRPTYENPRVMALLLSVDAMLERIDRSGGSCSTDDAMKAIDFDGLMATEDSQRGLIETMIRAGVLVRTGERLTIARPGAQIGYTRPWLVMTLVAWGIAKTRGWEMVPRSAIAARWPHHAKDRRSRSREIPAGELKTLTVEGEKLVNLARNAGLLLPHRNSDGKFGFAVRWDHPLAHFTRSAVGELMRILREATSEEKPAAKHDVLVEMIAKDGGQDTVLVPAPNTVFWISALASEGYVRIFRSHDGERMVQPLPRSEQLTAEP